MPNDDLRQGILTGILSSQEIGLPVKNLSDSAIRVLESRYLFKDKEGKITETPRQLFSRVAKAIAQVEAKWEKGAVHDKKLHIEKIETQFFDLIANLRFLPNSPTLMNAGRIKGQLSACFVLPIEDDLSAIFETLRNSAIVHKTGGGTGFNFGNVRPKNDIVSSSGGGASGPVAFLKIFDVATETIKQGGTRRGANMAILPIHHPDIESFITSKKTGALENFNISVGVTDEFMKALKNKTNFSLIHPGNKKEVRQVSANRIWKLIVENAWETGDPGLVFLDKIEKYNPTPSVGVLESTNPCGEQPLLAFESCNLGSMNLMSYVTENDFKWDELKEDIFLAVRFLDNVIEANSYPLLEIEEITLRNRKIGLGVMGWADVLCRWRIPYDSDEAVKRARQFIGKFASFAIEASEALALERGPFPEFSRSIYAKKKQAPRRNATVTTIAPTGTISIIAGVSSGIEPVFSLAYERIGLEGQRLVFVQDELKEILKKNNHISRGDMIEVIESGSIQKLRVLNKKLKNIFKTAHEISPVAHLKMQAAFQECTENGVSKTINLPATASFHAVKKIYEDAYALGCKGITVFRDRSKSRQVLNSGIKLKSKNISDALPFVDWLLDDATSKNVNRRKPSAHLATISRSQIKKQKSSTKI